MSNTVNLDDFEKINFLFKNYLGFPNTDKTKPFFLETAVKANNYLFGGEIFLDTIPLTPDFDINGSQNTANSLNIDSSKLDTSESTIYTDNTSIIRRFTKIKLEKISGTQRGYYCLDQNGNNILKDALQFNVNKADDGTQPYLYKLYTNSGVNSNEQILPNAAGGNWIFDVKNGVVNFPDIITGYTVSESIPPYLTFYKYVGRKGLNQLSTTDIIGLGIQTQNIQLQITELSGNLFDLSGNVDTNFTNINTRAADISQNVIDLSNNVYNKVFLDASSVEIYQRVSDLSGNVDTFISETDGNFINVVRNNDTDVSLNNLSLTDLYIRNSGVDDKVLFKEGADTLKLTTNEDNNLKIATSGSGVIQIENTTGAGNINITKNGGGNIQINSGVSTTDAQGNTINTGGNVIIQGEYKVNDINILDSVNNSISSINTRAADISQNVIDLSNEVDTFKSQTNNKFTSINERADDISQNVLNLDSTLRSYVDGLVSGLDVKQSVKAATIDAGNVDLTLTYDNQNILIIDGITISDKDRILLKNQTDKTENGIYDLSNTSLVRSNDFKTNEHISYGAFTFVELGNVNNDKGFILTKDATSPNMISVGTTELDFTQFSTAGKIVAGNGLAKNGEVISVNVDGSTINITNDIIHIHNDFIRQIDNSFNNVYIKSEVDNRFTNLETEIDASFNDIYTKAVIESRFTTLETEIDNSLNIIQTSIDVLEEGVTSSWILGAVGSSSYTFDGPGLNSSSTNPPVYLVRGQKYKFKNRTGGHPFRIQSDENGTSYDSGVTNNSGGNDKDIIFEVPMDAPSKLWYQCTAHPLMLGIIYIGDKKIHDVSNNVYSKTEIDTSFNDVIQTITNLSNNVYSKTDIDTSFNDVNQTITNLSNNVYLKTEIDTSFNDVNQTITNLSNNVYSKTDIDTSFNDVYSKTDIDTSFNDVNQTITNLSNNVYSKTDIDTSFNDINQTITNLSNNVYSKTGIDTSFNNVNQTITNLSNNVYSKTYIDTSFNDVNQTITNLSNNVYSKTDIDTSFNDVNQKIINLELDDLSNVDTNNLQNDQYLKYDASTSKWVPSSITTNTSSNTTNTSLNNISDVSFNINDLSEGNILMWSATTNKWEAKENQGGSGSGGGGGSGNGVTVIPSTASVDLSENILYPTANTGEGKEGDIIYDASQNLFYEASNSKTDIVGNGEVQFRPLGYSFFAKNMEGQAPNVQSTSFFFLN
jgi:hypothetical protein